MNYGAGNWRRIRKQQLSASLITENPKYKRDEKHKLNITIPLSYLSLRGRGKICLEKVGAHVLLLLSRKVRNDLIMFVNQLANSGMNCPKRIRNRTLRLAKMCRIRIWKQPLALIKNFHLTSLGHKKSRCSSGIFVEDSRRIIRGPYDRNISDDGCFFFDRMRNGSRLQREILRLSN